MSAVSGREVFATWYRTRWLLEHGVVDLRPLITEELDLARFERAFALLESGEACKIVLAPGRRAARAARRDADRRRSDGRNGHLPELGRWAHR